MTATPRSLSGLLPFLQPYRWPLLLAGVFLLLAAGAIIMPEEEEESGS